MQAELVNLDMKLSKADVVDILVVEYEEQLERELEELDKKLDELNDQIEDEENSLEKLAQMTAEEIVVPLLTELKKLNKCKYNVEGYVDDNLQINIYNDYNNINVEVKTPKVLLDAQKVLDQLEKDRDGLFKSRQKLTLAQDKVPQYKRKISAALTKKALESGTDGMKDVLVRLKEVKKLTG